MPELPDDNFPPLEREWRFDVQFMGWRRMFWWSLTFDFQYMCFGFIFFGLMVTYGHRIKRECTSFTNGFGGSVYSTASNGLTSRKPR